MRALLVALLLATQVSMPGDVLRRSDHWTDTVRAGGGTTRKIQNDINYTTDGTTYAPSEDAAQVGSFALDGDSYTYRKRSRMFFYADKQSGGRMAAAVQAARDPSCYLKIELVGATAGAPTVVDGATLRYDFHANGSLFLRAGRKALEKVVRLTGSIGQSYIEYDYKMPSTVTVTAVSDGWDLGCGTASYKVADAVTWDSDNGSVLGLDGTPIATTTTVVGNTVADGIRTVRLKVAPDSQAVTAALQAGKTVFIDPKTTISGTTSIVDTYLYNVNGSYNYGTATTGLYQSLNSTLIRVSSASIPLGAIVAARFYATSAANISDTRTAYMARMRSGRIEWIEGVHGGATASANEPTHTYYKYNTVSWGTSGARNTTTDYISTDAASVSVPDTADLDVALPVLTLPGSWFSDFRDGTGEGNAGMKFYSDTSSIATIYSSEGATPLYFEVDTASGAPRFGRIF